MKKWELALLYSSKKVQISTKNNQLNILFINLGIFILTVNKKKNVKLKNE